jgi:hypothetical protein
MGTVEHVSFPVLSGPSPNPAFVDHRASTGGHDGSWPLSTDDIEATYANSHSIRLMEIKPHPQALRPRQQNPHPHPKNPETGVLIPPKHNLWSDRCIGW